MPSSVQLVCGAVMLFLSFVWRVKTVLVEHVHPEVQWLRFEYLTVNGSLQGPFLVLHSLILELMTIGSGAFMPLLIFVSSLALGSPAPDLVDLHRYSFRCLFIPILQFLFDRLRLAKFLLFLSFPQKLLLLFSLDHFLLLVHRFDDILLVLFRGIDRIEVLVIGVLVGVIGVVDHSGRLLFY